MQWLTIAVMEPRLSGWMGLQFFVSASTRGRFISPLRTHIYLILQEAAHYALKREKKCYESGIWLYGPLLPSYSANYCNSISGDGPSSTEEFQLSSLTFKRGRLPGCIMVTVPCGVSSLSLVLPWSLQTLAMPLHPNDHNTKMMQPLQPSFSDLIIGKKKKTINLTCCYTVL